MKGQRIKYTEQELDYVSARRLMTRRDLWELYQQRYNRPEVTLNNLKALCKRKNWLTGRTGQYEKGNIPHPNARLKGPNNTSFKKDHAPANLRPIGSERINVEGYIEIKTRSGRHNWDLKHRVIWQQHNGPLNSGQLIRFKDSNPLNCNINNLELVNRAEHIELNRLDARGYPAEIQPTLLALAQVNVKMHRRIKTL